METNEIIERLKEFDEAFAGAATKAGFDPVPDGKYRATINSASIVESQFDGSAQLKIEYIVLSGDSAGRKVFKYYDLENVLRIPFLKQDLYRLEVEIEKLSELPSRLDVLLDKVVDIKLQTKEAASGKSYQNCYINGLAEAGEEVPF